MKENDREQELIAKKGAKKIAKEQPRQGQKGGEIARNNVVN